MGLFDINMPLLYGEGDKAFQRLQLALIKVSDDDSIFAWQSDRDVCKFLATSPAAFRHSGNLEQVSTWPKVPGSTRECVSTKKTYYMTQRGLQMKCTLLLRGGYFLPLSWQRDGALLMIGLSSNMRTGKNDGTYSRDGRALYWLSENSNSWKWSCEEEILLRDNMNPTIRYFQPCYFCMDGTSLENWQIVNTGYSYRGHQLNWKADGCCIPTGNEDRTIRFSGATSEFHVIIGKAGKHWLNLEVHAAQFSRNDWKLVVCGYDLPISIENTTPERKKLLQGEFCSHTVTMFKKCNARGELVYVIRLQKKSEE